MATYLFEELTVFGAPDPTALLDPEPHTLNVEFDFTCTSKGGPATGPTYSSGGEPAFDAEWEINEIRIVNPAMKPIVLDEVQFVTLFPDGYDILCNALEWAHEQEPE